MSKFTEGQEITLFVKGAGVTSEEKDIIEMIEDGVIHLEDSDKTFDLKGKCLQDDPFFGFEFWIE